MKFAVPALILGVALAATTLFTISMREKSSSTKPFQSKPEVQRQTAPAWTGSLDIFETPNRDSQLRLPQVFRALNLKSGSKVGDIGAGGGWLSVRLARKVGPSGRVYASEILPRYVQAIQTRAKRENLPQIEAVLGTLTDPKLPANSLDAVVILNAYHEFDKPLSMLAKVKASMKPGARLAFMERDEDYLRAEAEEAYRTTGRIKRRVDEKSDGNSKTDDHRLALPIVRREAETAGFKFVLSRELGDDHYVAVVEKVR